MLSQREEGREGGSFPPGDMPSMHLLLTSHIHTSRQIPGGRLRRLLTLSSPPRHSTASRHLRQSGGCRSYKDRWHSSARGMLSLYR